MLVDCEIERTGEEEEGGKSETNKSRYS